MVKVFRLFFCGLCLRFISATGLIFGLVKDRLEDVFSDGTHAETKIEKVLAAFNANDIDHNVVETLTESDLLNMNFSLGIRKAHLKGIGKLKGSGNCEESFIEKESTLTKNQRRTAMFDAFKRHSEFTIAAK